MAEWRAATDLALPHLGDLVEVQRAVGTSGAVTFDKATETSELTPLPDAPEGDPYVQTWSDSGSVTGADSFSFEQSVPIETDTQLVIVTAGATTDTGITIDGTTIPSPWMLYAFDYTADPGATHQIGASGSARWAQCALWVVGAAGTNHSIIAVCEAGASGLTFTAGVTISIRTIRYA